MSAKERGPGEVTCPACGSRDVGRAPRVVYKDIPFIVDPPWKCQACGVVFEARSNPVVCIVAATGFGLLTVGMVAMWLSDALGVKKGGDWVALAARLLNVGAIPFTLWITYVCLRTAVRSMRADRGPSGP